MDLNIISFELKGLEEKGVMNKVADEKQLIITVGKRGEDYTAEAGETLELYRDGIKINSVKAETISSSSGQDTYKFTTHTKNKEAEEYTFKIIKSTGTLLSGSAVLMPCEILKEETNTGYTFKVMVGGEEIAGSSFTYSNNGASFSNMTDSTLPFPVVDNAVNVIAVKSFSSIATEGPLIELFCSKMVFPEIAAKFTGLNEIEVKTIKTEQAINSQIMGSRVCLLLTAKNKYGEGNLTQEVIVGDGVDSKHIEINKKLSSLLDNHSLDVKIKFITNIETTGSRPEITGTLFNEYGELIKSKLNSDLIYTEYDFEKIELKSLSKLFEEKAKEQITVLVHEKELIVSYSGENGGKTINQHFSTTIFGDGDTNPDLTFYTGEDSLIVLNKDETVQSIDGLEEGIYPVFAKYTGASNEIEPVYIGGFEIAREENSSAKKIVDVGLGQVELIKEFKNLTLTNPVVSFKDDYPMFFISAPESVEEKEFAFYRNGKELEKYLLNNLKMTEKISGEKAIPFLSFVSKIASLKNNMTIPFYLTILRDKSLIDWIGEATTSVNFIKTKNLKFLIDLNDSHLKEADFLTISSELRKYKNIFLGTDEAPINSVEEESFGIVKEMPVQKEIIPELKVPNAADYSYENISCVNRNVYYLPVSDLFTTTEATEIKRILSDIQGIEDFYEDYIGLTTSVVVLPLISEKIFFKYNGKTQNLPFIHEDIYTKTKDGNIKLLKPHFAIQGIGINSKNIIDDFSGFHMTSVINKKGKLNRLLMKNEHNYLQKDMHVYLAQHKVSSVGYFMLEALAENNRIKNKNVGLISIQFKNAFNKLKESGLFYDYKIQKLAIEKSEDEEEKLFVDISLFFELGIKSIRMTLNYYFGV